MKYILIFFAIAGVGVGGFFAFNNYIYEAKQAPAEQYMSLEGSTWQWVRTDAVGKAPTAPPSGTPFVLTFSADGVHSTTDCNSISGSYTRGEVGALSFGPLAMTKMFCQGSVDTEYAVELAAVSHYAVNGNILYLSLAGDAGTMVFEREGAGAASGAAGGTQLEGTPYVPDADLGGDGTQSSPGYNPDEQVFCTADAMMCPDGTYVGRSGPNCQFVCP